MSMMLNLVENLYARANLLQQLSLRPEACRLYEQLVRLNDLPADLAEESQAQLGRLYFEQNRFRRARRHLTAALGYSPDCATYHHLIAQAIENDAKADPATATPHYRRCVELDPENATFLADLGLHALDRGERDEALACLRQAFELGNRDVEVVSKVVEGLEEAREWDEAAGKIRIARFLQPGDQRLEGLWNRHQFAHALARQSEKLHAEEDDSPVVLRFEMPEDGAQPSKPRKVFRFDTPSSLPGAHGPRNRRVPNWGNGA